MTKFKITIEPDLPDGELRAWLLRKIFHQVGKQVRETLPWHVRLGMDIYTPSNRIPKGSLDEKIFATTIESQEYRAILRVDEEAILWKDNIPLYFKVM